MAFNIKKLIKDSGEAIKSGVEKTQDYVKRDEFQNTLSGTKDKGVSAAQILKTKAGETARGIADVMSKKEEIKNLLTIEGVLKLMYLVMSSDGVIASEEKAQLYEIGQNIDAGFSKYQDAMMDECDAIVRKLDKEDYISELQDAARDIIDASFGKKESCISTMLTLWNLLAIALSDNEFADVEYAFIRYVAKHLDIDKSILPEMENYARALMAIEKEITWIKSANRPYSIVEARLNELSDRKAAIMQGVHMLISE